MKLLAKELQPARPEPPMTAAQAKEIIDRASKDERMSAELDALRLKCCTFIDNLMRDVNLDLAEKQKRTPALLKSPQQVSQASPTSLRSASRDREAMARKRRELAEAMVLGVLFNLDNPQWDPRDPGTARSEENFLVALVKSAFK
ncbi:hypothetical protein ACIPEN_02335 [Herbaspirillum chlorophenolicum]|uniref:Uncharacterized protein n=1 Tax=Herbaspirillum chlorophenolicum TaxID=211589 RepID=A0ABW8ETB4_9BURK|nr:hypothetical protein [Herbaspirillum chlorophenolicum]